jgi:hypothetical protein
MGLAPDASDSNLFKTITLEGEEEKEEFLHVEESQLCRDHCLR